jgi:hypothetical protein
MKLLKFFDKLEDKVRNRLSHYPIFYAFFGGVGVVLFWRGVWYTADLVVPVFDGSTHSMRLWETVSVYQILDGPISILVSVILLLITGLFASTFIGNEIIISGLRGERKLTEKTEIEVKTETSAIAEIKSELKKISERLEKIEEKLK